MDDQERRVTKYLIPANVSTRFEFFEGFGWYEFKFVVIALLIGASIFFASGFLIKTVEINPNDITMEQRIGANPEDFKLNNNGMVERKVQVIPLPIRLLFVLIPTVGTFFFVRKDPSIGMSVMEMIKSNREFHKRQKLYLYKYDSGMGA